MTIVQEPRRAAPRPVEPWRSVRKLPRLLIFVVTLHETLGEVVIENSYHGPLAYPFVEFVVTISQRYVRGVKISY